MLFLHYTEISCSYYIHVFKYNIFILKCQKPACPLMKINKSVCVQVSHTVPLLEGSPLHVDVGFEHQVDLTGPIEHSPSLVHTVRLQVMNVLSDTQAHMKQRSFTHTSFSF